MKQLVVIVFIMHCSFAVFSNDTLDSLIQKLEKHPYPDSVRVDLLNQLGYQYWIVEPIQSEIYGNEALELAGMLKYHPGAAFAYRVVGVSHWARGNYSTAQEYLLNGLKLYQALNDSIGIGTIYNNLGLVYFDQRSYETGLAYFEQALTIYRSLNNEEREVSVLGNLGMAHLKLNNYKKAEEIFNDVLVKNLQFGGRYGIAESHSNLGQFHLSRKEHNKALTFFDESLKIRKQIPDLEGMAMCLNFIGETYLEIKDFSKAKEHLLQGIDAALSVSSRKWLSSIYETLKDLEVAQGNFDQALAYFEIFSAKKDSLFDEEKYRQIAEMQTRFAVLQKEQKLLMQQKELEILRQGARMQSIVRNSLILSLLLIGVIGYLTVSRQQLKIRKNKELLTKNQEVYMSKQALAQAEIENARLQEKKLLQEIEFKNKELTSYTINFIQKNELMEELKTSIEKLRVTPDIETNRKLNGLNRLVENGIHIDKDWEDFKRHFEEVHKDFFKILKERCPQLTSNELKLCTLIRLNMNLKEAAKIMGISPESVKTARYRLRRKLNLSREENLIDYIIKLEKGLLEH